MPGNLNKGPDEEKPLVRRTMDHGGFIYGEYNDTMDMGIYFEEGRYLLIQKATVVKSVLNKRVVLCDPGFE